MSFTRYSVRALYPSPDFSLLILLVVEEFMDIVEKYFHLIIPSVWRAVNVTSRRSETTLCSSLYRFCHGDCLSP